MFYSTCVVYTLQNDPLLWGYSRGPACLNLGINVNPPTFVLKVPRTFGDATHVQGEGIGVPTNTHFNKIRQGVL